MSQFPAALQPSPEDIKMMLACEVHRGSRNLDPNMERYIWERRSDGIFFFFVSFFFVFFFGPKKTTFFFSFKREKWVSPVF